MTDAALPPRAPRALGFKAALMEFVLVLVIAVVAGAAFETTRPAPAPAAKPAAASAAEPSTVFDLAPVVTNLDAPPDVWIRLEASIVFDPKTLPHPEGMAAKLDDDILAYARTLPLKRLEGPIGLESIRQDLNERAVIRSEGKVKELVIRTLVVQ